jgi:hypothetical protein
MLYVFAGMRAGCFSRCLPQPANLDIGLFVLLEYTPSAFDVSFFILLYGIGTAIDSGYLRQHHYDLDVSRYVNEDRPLRVR